MHYVVSIKLFMYSIDNSDWTRNGDYQPSRWEAQIEAANLISESKCDKNPENCLGVVSMAGKRVETPVTLTSDVAKILKSYKEIAISGESDFITACNISLLVLKHRQNKNQKQRIILFVASPVKHSTDEMTLLGKKLKKNNVAIDIISFGNTDINHEALNQLYSNANNSNNSSLLEVEMDQYIVDLLFTSPILNDNTYENGTDLQAPTNTNPVAPSSNNAQGGGLSQFERDINLAIQQSIEEEERRNALKNQEGQPPAQATEGTNSSAQPSVTNQAPEVKKTENQMNVDEEIDEDLAAELEKARLLSIQEHEITIKKEKENEQQIKDDLLQDKDFIQGVLDELDIENTNEEKKDNHDESSKDNK